MAFHSKKEKEVAPMEARNTDTVIGKETDIEGSINSSGIIRIEGNFKGEIFTSSNVVIEESGVVNGNVKAAKVSVAGTLEGNVISFESLQIQSTGKLIGDIEVKSICIAQGAIFKGKSTMMNEVYKEADIQINESESYYLEE